MRSLMILIMALFLTACGTGHDENATKNENHDIKKNESVAVQDNFKLELISEKSQYEVGEPLNITAELTYTGKEAIDIGHGGSWIFLNTTNVTKGYEFGATMNEPYIVTTLRPKEPLVEQYQFSGGTYFEEGGGTPYTDEEFEQMASMNFPPGKYKIEGITEFRIDGEEQSYRMKAEIWFEITKQETNSESKTLNLVKVEDKDFFKSAIKSSQKEQGIMNMANPQFQFALDEDSYFLWITEESGTIMNTNDTHTIFTLSNSAVKAVYAFVNKESSK